MTGQANKVSKNPQLKEYEMRRRQKAKRNEASQRVRERGQASQPARAQQTTAFPSRGSVHNCAPGRLVSSRVGCGAERKCMGKKDVKSLIAKDPQR